MTVLSFEARRRSGHASSWRSGALALALASATLVLPGCGAGGLADLAGIGAKHPSTPSAVAIVTTSIPSAGVGAPYSTSLAAAGGASPYAWTLSAGSSLPSGLSISSDGTIAGSVAVAGSYTFDVVVSDASSPAQTDAATYTLGVSAFDASVALLRFGEAWTGESYPVSATGAAGTTFSLVQNQSGASLVGANPAGSTVTYRAGSVPGADRIRATSASSETVDLDVAVVRNPVGGMTARFSSSDVWHLRFDGKFDASHPYASDWDWSLMTVGLRDVTSTSATGTTADELASLYARQQVLRYLNADYLNNEDGTPKAGGLAISFPFFEPTPPHFAPADGAVASPAINQFNVLSITSGGAGGVIGTGYLDDVTNDFQENNTTTSSSGTLGVFVDEIAPIFNAAYSNNTLPGAPVGASDVAALKALLYGLPKPPASRYDEIQRVAEGFGRTLAAVAAHEIGHSLGLNHTSPAQASSIMNAGAIIAPSATYQFVASDVTVLHGGLPGPGRGGAPLHVEALRIAGPGEGDVGGGIPCVCNCGARR